MYSITGKDTRYPTLNNAFSGVHANIHPNCRHVISPYIPELADDAQRDLEFSNRPFEIDERSQAEMDKYNEQQFKKARIGSDRDQYERYMLAFGGNAPKTFSGFMASKRSNSENWKQMQHDYRIFMNAKQLPNFQQAVVPIEKIRDYALNIIIQAMAKIKPYSLKQL